MDGVQMGVYRVPVTLTYPNGGPPGVNVFSLRIAADPLGEGDEIDNALNQLMSFYGGISDQLAPGTTVSMGPDIVNRETLEDASRPYQSTGSTVTGSAAPPHLAAVISWKTSLRARRGVGRSFIGPLYAGAIDVDGTIAPATVSDIQTRANQLISASASALNAWAFGVWGLDQPGEYDDLGRLKPDQPHVHRDFVSMSIKDQFGVLRSRRD